MMTKEILTGKEGRDKVLAGLKKAVDAAKHTLGVIGKTAMISNGNFAPDITDDGVTVLKNISLPDPYENMGAQLLKRVAIETNEKAGDGTTTSAVLAHALVEECLKEIGDDSSKVRNVVERLEAGLKETIAFLEQNRQQVLTDEDIERVAVISCLDEEIGKLIAKTIKDVGTDGVVTVDESTKIGLESEVVKGMRIDAGFINDYFIENKDRAETVLSNPYICVTDARITTNKQIKSLLVNASSSGKKDMIIFAEEIAGEALATLTINFHGKQMRAVPIKVTGSKRKDILKDISILTDTTFITEEMGKKIDEVSLGELGLAGRVVITKNSVTILDGKGSDNVIESRCEEIRQAIDATPSDVEKDALKSRLASLAGGIGVIRVGDYTDTALQAKKYKIEDAINATKCALAEGILPGGGTALAKASFVSKDSIFIKSLCSPLRQMAENSGYTSWVLLADDDFWTGYDFKDGEVKNLHEAGILDPFKVTRLALENAVSIASTLITAETFIVEKDYDKPNRIQQLDTQLDSGQ